MPRKSAKQTFHNFRIWAGETDVPPTSFSYQTGPFLARTPGARPAFFYGVDHE